MGGWGKGYTVCVGVVRTFRDSDGTLYKERNKRSCEDDVSTALAPASGTAFIGKGGCDACVR